MHPAKLVLIVTVSSSLCLINSQYDSSEVKQENSSGSSFVLDCLASQISKPPQPADSITRLAALMARQVYRDPTEFAMSFGAQSVEIFSNSETGVYAAAVISQRAAIIAFRGTETQEKADIDTILNVGFDRAGAHAGFSKALGSIYSDMMSFLNSTIEGDDMVVIATGHSMGGALATLFAERLMSDPSKAFGINAVYTFGSPRPGSKGWASRYSRLDLDGITLRFIRDNDIISLVPSLQSGYSHVGRAIFLPQNLDGCSEQEDPEFEFQCKSADIIDNSSKKGRFGGFGAACKYILGNGDATKTLLSILTGSPVQEKCEKFLNNADLCAVLIDLMGNKDVCCYATKFPQIRSYHANIMYEKEISIQCTNESSNLQVDNCFQGIKDFDAMSCPANSSESMMCQEFGMMEVLNASRIHLQQYKEKTAKLLEHFGPMMDQQTLG